MEALHEKLSESVEALRGSEQWAAYLRFCRSFRTRVGRPICGIRARQVDRAIKVAVRARRPTHKIAPTMPTTMKTTLTAGRGK